MKKHYFTFGQDHIHRYDDVILDKDIIVEMEAEDPRAKMFELFGDKWCFEYNSFGDLNPELFRRGVFKISFIRK